MNTLPKFKFDVVDFRRLYGDLGISHETLRTTEKFQADPGTVPQNPDQDDGERAIRDACFDASASWHDDCQDFEHEQIAARARFSVRPDLPSSILREAETDFTEVVRRYRETIAELVQKLTAARDNVLKLKQHYDLDRSPRYVSDPTSAYWISAGVALVEVAFGTASLVNTNTLGLTGGAMLAVLLTLLNVGGGAISGLVAPQAFAPQTESAFKRVVGIVFPLVMTPLAVLANLAFGFVRGHGIDGLTTSLKGFWSGAIVPSTLESLVLVVLGTVIYGGSFLRYSTLRDPYPQYEMADREVKRLEAEIENLEHEVGQSLRGILDTNQGQLESLIQNARGQHEQCCISFAISEAAARKFKTGYDRIVRAYQHCADRRRLSLKRSCARVPAYWQTSKVDFSDVLADTYSLATAKAQMKRVEGQAITVENAAINAKEILENLYRNAQETLHAAEEEDTRQAAE